MCIKKKKLKKNIKSILTKYEGTEELLYSDPSNPYESIYIRAKINDGQLTVTDSECEFGSDGGWSHRTLVFDKDNTKKVLSMLLERNSNPFSAMRNVISYKDRTKIFREMCDKRGINYKNMMSF